MRECSSEKRAVIRLKTVMDDEMVSNDVNFGLTFAKSNLCQAMHVCYKILIYKFVFNGILKLGVGVLSTGII